MIILNHKLSIFMMKKDNNGYDLSEINNQAKEQLTKVFGGLTITNAKGLWIDGNKVYVDDSYIFSCNYSRKLNNSQVNVFINVVKDELSKGKQQTVSIMIDDTLYILDSSDLDELKDILSTR